MILKKLKLQNIRSYQSQEINFPEGIVLLSGDIGAGKTTILLAIEFALFGFSKRTLSGDLLLRHGKHEGSVELSFLLNANNNTSNNQSYSAKNNTNNNQEYNVNDNTNNNQDDNAKSNMNNNQEYNTNNHQNNVQSNTETNNQNNTQNNIQSNWQPNRQKEVIIKRMLRRSNQVKQESGYIIVDGVKTECTPSELKTKVLELLGYPQEMVTKSTDVIYRYTVYTPQEEMKIILLVNKEDRLQTLRKVFGIDRYKRIKDNAKIITGEIKQKKRGLEGFVSDLESKKTKVMELQALSGSIDSQKTKIADELSILNMELRKKTEEHKKLSSKRKE